MSDTDDFPNFGGIDGSTWQVLAESARQVRDHAYVPYSDFPVGAAILTPGDHVSTGCNVENATIGATVCAERGAISDVVAKGHREIKALCVVTDVSPPSAPCGICRQVLAEFCDDLPILMINPHGESRFTTLDDLLPMRFSGRDFNEPTD